MSALPVEWVLVVFYGPSAHRATYGRLNGTSYTKDYIQLSQRPDFIADISSLFPNGGDASVPIAYKWPLGEASGHLVFHSADRPHLAWETKLGAPAAWRMSVAPSEFTAETIPGNPAHIDPVTADAELALVPNRGGGQPYLVAVKLLGEANTLHLRVYLANPAKNFEWADVRGLPPEIQALAKRTSKTNALAWARIGAAPEGELLFNPTRNHDAWTSIDAVLVKSVELPSGQISSGLADISSLPNEDLIADFLPFSEHEVDNFRKQIESNNYEVDDKHSTMKTRGSAQKAFAEKVKKNYNSCCAITGIKTKDFLVAAHIVPWHADKSIRLDPANGICLSLLMDRAFENGFLIIDNSGIVSVRFESIKDDLVLMKYLLPYDGKKLTSPTSASPKQEYLERRRKHFLGNNALLGD